MIANLGFDPLATAIVVGLMTSVLPFAFYELWWDVVPAQLANVGVVVALTVVGWGFTSHPWIWPLVATMLLVAYGVNQAASNLAALVIRLVKIRKRKSRRYHAK
nr:MAG TPA: hypothetical protein [Bacteriophage sp.]